MNLLAIFALKYRRSIRVFPKRSKAKYLRNSHKNVLIEKQGREAVFFTVYCSIEVYIQQSDSTFVYFFNGINLFYALLLFLFLVFPRIWSILG